MEQLHISGVAFQNNRFANEALQRLEAQGDLEWVFQRHGDGVTYNIIKGDALTIVNTVFSTIRNEQFSIITK